MKKVLFIAHVQSHIMNFHKPFIKYFENNGYQVFVATKLDEEKYKDSYSNFKNTKFINIDFSRNPYSLDNIKALKSLIKLMKNEKFDLIHTHTPVGGFLGRLAARVTKSGPILYTAHGFHFYNGAPIKNWMLYYTAEKIAARWTDGLITINEEDFKIAKKKLKIKNNNIYKVNGVGVNLDIFNKLDKNIIKNNRKNLNIEEEDFILLMIGENNKNKNQIQLINVMKKFQITEPKIKAILIGGGNDLEKNRKYIKEKNIENVKIIGYRSDINNYINISDVIVSMSYREGLPKNILEAMAVGKPILCTNVRGNNDLIENGYNGILVKLNDLEGTCKAIKYMYENDSEIKKMGNRNLDIIKNYSEDKVLKDMKKIYSKFTK